MGKDIKDIESKYWGIILWIFHKCMLHPQRHKLFWSEMCKLREEYLQELGNGIENN
jgi:hypothetical protein